MEDTFWQMIQEQNIRVLEKATAKAVLHVSQGRPNRLVKLNKHTEKLLIMLKASGDCDQLVDALNQMLADESRMSDAVDLLKATHQKKTTDTTLKENTQVVIARNTSLIRRRNDLLETLKDFPKKRQALEPVTAAVEHLGRVSERLTAIIDPQSTVGDFAHIHNSSAEITSFRKETQKLIEGILHHKESIDSMLAGLIQNYAPNRVAPVDRAILRLATFEITHCEDIPIKVSINEAVEIAKKFSTSESSRFINGVLDAIQS
ncbi:MAG: transcription antitermination factor NusB [Akkermansiaceae bacterium]|nr:transcription antitermination factor NusB [Akkermansiaceae bacterium]